MKDLPRYSAYVPGFVEKLKRVAELEVGSDKSGIKFSKKTFDELDLNIILTGGRNGNRET